MNLIKNKHKKKFDPFFFSHSKNLSVLSAAATEDDNLYHPARSVISPAHSQQGCEALQSFSFRSFILASQDPLLLIARTSLLATFFLINLNHLNIHPLFPRTPMAPRIANASISNLLIKTKTLFSKGWVN